MELTEKVLALVEEGITDSCDIVQSKPPPLSHNYDYPNKSEAIAAHKSRFAHL